MISAEQVIDKIIDDLTDLRQDKENRADLALLQAVQRIVDRHTAPLAAAQAAKQEFQHMSSMALEAIRDGRVVGLRVPGSSTIRLLYPDQIPPDTPADQLPSADTLAAEWGVQAQYRANSAAYARQLAEQEKST